MANTTWLILPIVAVTFDRDTISPKCNPNLGLQQKSLCKTFDEDWMTNVRVIVQTKFFYR